MMASVLPRALPCSALALFAASLFPLAACVPPRRAGPPAPPVAPSTATASVPPVEAVPPGEWPAFRDDLDAESMAQAAERTAAYLRASGDTLYPVGDRTAGTQLLVETAEELVRLRRETPDPAELGRRIREGFDLYRFTGANGDRKVLFSSYYQPVLEARLKGDERFRYPLFRKPTDMIEAELGAFNEKWKGETLIGRLDGGRLVPYFDRRAIDVRGVLAGRGLEAAWLESQFERLDLHIQGSGILRLGDGSELLARFAATNALPYKSVGLSVVGAGAMTREAINHEALKRYLAEHPEGEAWLLSRNPRYTFFDVVDLPPGGEPFGTISQQLVPGRSIAIDPKVAPLGVVALAVFPMAQADAEGRLLGKSETSRFMFAHDTGGAIKSPNRVDVYAGHGAGAKALATRVWDTGSLYILLKKLPPRAR